jgi:hypothetical protein
MRMSSSDSWIGSAQELWRDLTEGERFPRLVKWILALVLVSGTVWSALVFSQMFSTMRGSDTPPPAANAATGDEIRRLDETAKGFRNAVTARTGSTQLAVLASTVGRKPFMPPGAGDYLPETALEGAGTPMIWVKAVMIKGQDAAAVVDIEGFGDGVILKKGASFGDGRGKVVSITNDRVVVTWSGQKIDIPVDRQ